MLQAALMIQLKYHFSIKNHYILLSAYITAVVLFNSSQPRGNWIFLKKFRRNDCADVPCFPCPLVSYKCFLVVVVVGVFLFCLICGVVCVCGFVF